MDGPASGEKGSKGRNWLGCIRGNRRKGPYLPEGILSEIANRCPLVATSAPHEGVARGPSRLQGFLEYKVRLFNDLGARVANN